MYLFMYAILGKHAQFQTSVTPDILPQFEGYFDNLSAQMVIFRRRWRIGRGVGADRASTT